jgi:hypothetical protein
MELNERIRNEIAAVFRRVRYGTITFHVNPDKKTLDYTVQTTHKITLGQNVDYDRVQPKTTA